MQAALQLVGDVLVGVEKNLQVEKKALAAGLGLCLRRFEYALHLRLAVRLRTHTQRARLKARSDA